MAALRLLRTALTTTARPLAATAVQRTLAPAAWRPILARSTRALSGLPAWLARRPTAAPAAVPTLRRTMFIQTETTPNDDSLKFRPGVSVMQEG